MGGFAFKDHNVSSATHSDYNQVVNQLNNLFTATRAAGSTQRFESGYLWETTKELGDLDFVVQASKEVIISKVESNPKFIGYKRSGNTISTLFKTRSAKNIQVDLMPTSNVDDEAWIMSNGSNEIKGVVRNVLICFLAMLKSEIDSSACEREVKWTVAFPGGIGLRENGAPPKERITDPARIMQMLGLPNQISDVEIARSFEGMVSLITLDNSFVDRFEDYAKDKWIYKKQLQMFNTAFRYMRKSIVQKKCNSTF